MNKKIQVQYLSNKKLFEQLLTKKIIYAPVHVVFTIDKEPVIISFSNN